jgi:hypothetical protein
VLKSLLEFNPACIAIASSGYSNDPVMANPKQFGFSGSVKKPYTKEELGQILERVFPK